MFKPSNLGMWHTFKKNIPTIWGDASLWSTRSFPRQGIEQSAVSLPTPNSMQMSTSKVPTAGENHGAIDASDFV